MASDVNLNELYKCIMSRCGVCQASCPVYSTTSFVLDSMRGKLAIIHGVERGFLPETVMFYRSMYTCTLCGLCEVKCPPGVKTVKIIEDVRSLISSRLGDPPFHSRILGYVREKGHPYSDPHILPHRVRGELSDVVYFPGCTTLFRLPQVLRSTLNLLEGLLGFKVAVVEGCCYGVVKRLGALELFSLKKHSLERLVKSYSEIKEIVVTCAGCYSTLKTHYDLGKVKVRHVSELLDELLKSASGLNTPLGNAVYHDPCHLGRHSGIYHAPRGVIAKVGVNLKEFKDNMESSLCCGGGGGLMSGFRDLAEAIALRRLREALKLGVQNLVTACPFCEVNFRNAARKFNVEVKVLDLVELLSL